MANLGDAGSDHIYVVRERVQADADGAPIAIELKEAAVRNVGKIATIGGVQGGQPRLRWTELLG
jgi:hypothetical protein